MFGPLDLQEGHAMLCLLSRKIDISGVPVWYLHPAVSVQHTTDGPTVNRGPDRFANCYSARRCRRNYISSLRNFHSMDSRGITCVVWQRHFWWMERHQILIISIRRLKQNKTYLLPALSWAVVRAILRALEMEKNVVFGRKSWKVAIIPKIVSQLSCIKTKTMFFLHFCL